MKLVMHRKDHATVTEWTHLNRPNNSGQVRLRIIVADFYGEGAEETAKEWIKTQEDKNVSVL